ncbi:MAG: ABC transporter ATP-binding protein [Anaerolineales bacterium]
MKYSPILTVSGLNVTFSDNNGGLRVLSDLSFEVCPREFICFLGPSGAGKTTLLRALAHLIRPDSGKIHYVHHARPKIGMVFQQPNLMPWRTARENIALPLELSAMSAEKIRRKTEDMQNLVGLRGFEDSYPRELSGGMAQRVALARALIHGPDILLLDEPFAALDAITRERMWGELSRIWQETQKTIIMVTHSINEALFLADRVLVLTQRPAQIKLDLTVELPRPRKDDIRYTPHFGKLARKLREAIE